MASSQLCVCVAPHSVVCVGQYTGVHHVQPGTQPGPARTSWLRRSTRTTVHTFMHMHMHKHLHMHLHRRLEAPALLLVLQGHYVFRWLAAEVTVRTCASTCRVSALLHVHQDCSVKPPAQSRAGRPAQALGHTATLRTWSRVASVHVPGRIKGTLAPLCTALTGSLQKLLLSAASQV